MWVKFQDSSTLLQKVPQNFSFSKCRKKKKEAKTLTFVGKKPNDSQIAFFPKPWKSRERNKTSLKSLAFFN